MEPGNLERFFGAYPEGKLISVVRDPRAWYVSASKYKPHYFGDVEDALELWRRSARAAIESASRFDPNVLLLTYEQLVLNTEETMRAAADWIGITMSPRLVEPTFNGWSIRANSSDPVRQAGILAERASAYQDSLGADTIKRIDELAEGLYERVAAIALAPSSSR
jgi:hypothetical protein